jgi:hypothetical protein
LAVPDARGRALHRQPLWRGPKFLIHRRWSEDRIEQRWQQVETPNAHQPDQAGAIDDGSDLYHSTSLASSLAG